MIVKKIISNCSGVPMCSVYSFIHITKYFIRLVVTLVLVRFASNVDRKSSLSKHTQLRKPLVVGGYFTEMFEIPFTSVMNIGI